MKIRRILATAVAAAVTTPAVFLSAAPAFADTPTVPGQTVQDTAGNDDPDGDDFAEYEKLLAAVAAAEEKIEALNAERDAVEKKIEAKDVGEAVATELTEAKAALAAAKAAKTAADEKLADAKDALAALPETATQADKDAAAKAVEDAEKVVEAAVAAQESAQERRDAADEAYDDANVELFRQLSRIDTKLEKAEQELADAEDALEEFEGGGEICEEEDPSLTVALSGPKTITAGTSAVFSMRVTNTSDQALGAVEAYASALQLPGPDEIIDEETDWESHLIQVEWSSADNLEWTELSEEVGPVEIGTLVKGGSADVKLRLTVDADAPAGEGMAFAGGAYETNDDEDCGMGEDVATAYFDILAAKDDKPKPSPSTSTPAPSPSTTTPTPAPSVTTGNTHTTQQGGSSNTPVNNGTLAATGANDTLPLGLAAAGAVVLGAGALVVARRRKAGANA
ncbi:LPXTG cell wall anchor domain-containing protein [Streptomyces sp. NBC_00094]|uniref:LPXTG cell wall anchor domain-containing protein n=1 Tax=Streptomyces sp. NBC_00094 TaxID=2903620 RepID=UPI0022586AC9|nr:LPXTG cell wall anchor domain-containing protein [Streptomyces sp. NBC_00094]MCX5392480.1 LPXTG cell wall anchor domain-containing protein [Streptomyces sp. NBC_00094]